jgi:hypothetical protein
VQRTYELSPWTFRELGEPAECQLPEMEHPVTRASTDGHLVLSTYWR